MSDDKRQAIYVESNDVPDGVQLRANRRRVNHAVRDSVIYLQSLLLLNPPTKRPPDPVIAEQQTGPSPGLFFTLRVLFWDVAVSLGDTVTDIAQAAALLSDGKAGFIFGLFFWVIFWSLFHASTMS